MTYSLRVFRRENSTLDEFVEAFEKDQAKKTGLDLGSFVRILSSFLSLTPS